MLITFSGVDCAGKSTQVELLRSALLEHGRKSFVFWLRPGYSAELNALKTLARRFAPSALPTAAAPAAREEAFSRSGVSTAWIHVATLDMAYQYGVKLRALSMAGRTVIADRYLDDSRLDFELRFPGRAVGSSPLFRAVSAVAPRPAHAFLLMLSHDMMLRRMAEKREPFPDPPSVRDQRFEAYRRLAATGRYTVIDAERPPAVIHGEILSTVLRARRER